VTPRRDFPQCYKIFWFLIIDKRLLTQECFKIYIWTYTFFNCVLDEIRHRLCISEHLLGGREGETRHQEWNRWIRQTQLSKTEFGHVPVLQKHFESNLRELFFFATGECVYKVMFSYYRIITYVLLVGMGWTEVFTNLNLNLNINFFSNSNSNFRSFKLWKIKS